MLSDDDPNANRKSEAAGSLAPASATRQSPNPYKEQHVERMNSATCLLSPVKGSELKSRPQPNRSVLMPSQLRKALGHMLDRRMYLRNASDFQRPRARICASERPQLAANVAAPIRKLCPLYFEESSPQL